LFFHIENFILNILNTGWFFWDINYDFFGNNFAKVLLA